MGTPNPFLRMQNLFGNQMGSNGIDYRTPPFVPEGQQFGGNTPNEPLFPVQQVRDTAMQVSPNTMPSNDMSPEFEFKAQKKFEELMGELPERERPTALRRIGAMIAGIGGGINRGQGFQEAQMVLNAPYDQKVADWKTKMEPAETAMREERQTNNLMRQTRSSEATARNQADRNRITEENNRVRYELAMWKNKNTNNALVEGRDGFVHLVNKATGEDIKTEVSHLEMDALTKMTMGLENDLTKIAATGEQARQTEGVRQAGDMEQIGARTSGTLAGIEARGAITDRQLSQRQRDELARITARATSRTTSGGSVESQTQLKQRYLNNANAAIAKNPEWKDWIDLDGEFPIVAENDSTKGGFFGFGNVRKLDDTTRQKIVDAVYGDSVAQPVRTNNSSSSSASVTMTGPNGKDYQIPSDKVDQAKKDGLKVK